MAQGTKEKESGVELGLLRTEPEMDYGGLYICEFA